MAIRDTFDTPDYVQTVKDDPQYLKSFNGVTVEEMAKMDFEKRGVEGVSGSTLTSFAIAEGLKRRAAQLEEASKLASASSGRSWWVGLRLGWADAGLLAFWLGALVMSFTHLRSFRWVRRVWQAGLIVGVGWWFGGMLSQALLFGWAEQGIPWREAPVLVLLAGSALLVPWQTGRQTYCHHYCPHGAVQQWLERLRLPRLRISPRLVRWLERIPALILVILVAGSLAGVRWNRSAWEPFDAYPLGWAALASFILFIAGLVASAFFPLAYCRFGCPTGALLRFVRKKGADTWSKADSLALLLWLAALCF